MWMIARMWTVEASGPHIKADIFTLVLIELSSCQSEFVCIPYRKPFNFNVQYFFVRYSYFLLPTS